jgi:hypothetical protein
MYFLMLLPAMNLLYFSDWGTNPVFDEIIRMFSGSLETIRSIRVAKSASRVILKAFALLGFIANLPQQHIH